MKFRISKDNPRKARHQNIGSKGGGFVAGDILFQAVSNHRKKTTAKIEKLVITS